ncbi:MAG: cell surface protein SprA [Bacteroidota bacterium]
MPALGALFSAGGDTIPQETAPGVFAPPPPPATGEPPPELKEEAPPPGEKPPERTPEEIAKDSLKAPADSLKAPGDSLKAPGDSTLAAADTGYVVYLDSTARMAHFTHQRRDRPQVELYPDRLHPLFARIQAPGYRRELLLDSTGSTVTIRQKVRNEDVRIPLTLSLKEYVTGRRKFELWKSLADEVRKPPTAAARDDLGELLTQITQIQIPIPQNPILSIFGKPEIRLNISGAVDIKAGFRNTQSDQTQLSRLDQSRNEPDFAQEVQVNVNGTIGDKLNILADWNTQRTFEYENQLKIKYTGYDDEIVQSVEAGNVSLQTPSAFIGSSQALFGVKAQFQTGPLRLTALASQKKGQIKEVSVSGGAQKNAFQIRAWNYSTNNFFVDTSYVSSYEPYYNNDPPQVNGSIQIVEEEVWVQRQGTIPDPNERQAIAYIDLAPRDTGYADALRSQTENPGIVETGKFVRLARNQYEMTGDGYIGVLSLNTNVQDQQVVGIAYRRADGTQFGELSRDFGTDTSRTVVLKMVKPRNLNANGPRYVAAWRQLLKNIYSVGGRNLKPEGFTLDIFRENAGAEEQNGILGEPLLRVLGLDRYNANGTPAPDGDALFDFRPRITVSLTRAEIIFPTLRPFDNGLRSYFTGRGIPLETPDPDSSQYLYRQIYDTTRTFAQQNNERDKYVIRGEATGDATSKYTLGFNVVEGSVQVLLDGRVLTPNVDYTVDYIVGEVIIRNDRALVPGANLQIKYEQNDLFQLASKTLLGARGDLYLSQSTLLGFTIMNLNQETLSDKVRLGEEPNNNTIIGVDGSTLVDLPFLTRWIDAVPLLQTKEPSQFKITGEAAYMMPDPNTKKSPIPGDQGEAVAYLDDFEGARRTLPVGINYAQWSLSSAPADSASEALFGSVDSVKTYSRGKMIWFNRQPTDVALTDVFPRKRPGKAANDQITVMDVQFYPSQRGQFNYSPDPGVTLTPQKNWGGLMKTLSISATNLINENVNFIELWMQVNRLPALQPDYRMVVELGAVSEDVIPQLNPRGERLHDEDFVVSTNPNGTLQEGEDVGLDMLTDAQERARYSTIAGIDLGDPSGDNYAFSNSTVGTAAEDYTRINGSEDNKNSPNGLIPETEDLNNNGIVDQANSYFRYVLPINTDTTLYPNPYIVGGGNKGWYQFRIPIRDYAAQVGTPSFENVEFIRILFLNASDTVAVRIADFGLVGNQWQELRKDSTFAVSVISIEDNPAYESPPGVIRERDKTRPDEEVYANEQSLALLVTGLPDGQLRQAVKYYTFRPLDLFNYRTMKMFVHGDEAFQYRGENDYDAEFFFRFGVDTLNFYEYRAPIRPGWDPLNEMVIFFEDLTAIKQRRDSVNVLSEPRPVPNGPPGAVYRVRGNPSLIQVRFMAVGVENPEGIGPPLAELTGQVWVNELRLIGVDDAPGLAYRVDTQLKLADFGTLAFNYSHVDPNFHTLEQRFGSRQTGINWGLNASIAVEKLFPSDWLGTSMPFSYSHTEAVIKPRYLPNSDVVVDEAALQAGQKILESGGTEADAEAEAQRIIGESRTIRVTDTYAAPTLRIGLPSREWFIRDTFNRLMFGFNYTRSRERNPVTERSVSWQWSARLSWALNFSPEYYIAPFQELFDGLWFLDEYKDLKLYYTPTNVSWSFTATRQRTTTLQRAAGSRETISRNFTSARQMGFGWKLTEGGMLNLAGDYNLTVNSSWLGLETNRFGQQRSFARILGDIFSGDKFVNFGDDTQYGQRNSITTKPVIPNIFGIRKYLDITFGYGVDYNWNNSLLPGDLGKSAGWTNNLTFNANFRLKQLIDPLFGDDAPAPVAVPGGRGRRGSGTPEAGPDTTVSAPDTSGGGGGMSRTLGQIKGLLRFLVKMPFLDYDNIGVTFTQTNTSQNSGVPGRTGFVNFWGRVPFFQEPEARYGPSRLYQLGLISDPTGRLTNFGARSNFPFFGWDVEPGLRARGGVLVNSFRQTNKVSLKTSRALWEGARAELSWNLGWSYNRVQNVESDSATGAVRIRNSTTTGSVERSFLTFPDVFFLGVFKSNLKEVSKRYNDLKNDRDTTLSDDEKLAVAFEEGFEAFPFLRKLFGQYYPRVNWSVRWDGLEKIPLFSGFVNRLSLDHAYTATYQRQYRNLPPAGVEQTDGQRVAYGFTPLVGLNFTFKDLFKGGLGATMRYNTNTSYDLQTSSRNIVETLAQEISVTANYTRRGFEIPLFGVSLNNDVDISFSYSVTKNSRRQYEIARLDVNTEGSPLDGNTRTVMEPRIRYVLSSRVTASVYYRYTNIAPDDSGSRIPGSTTNEAGLDIHISIQ